MVDLGFELTEPEALRYISLMLIGVFLTFAGLIGFAAAGQITSQLPGVIMTASELAPGTVPALQSFQSLMGLSRIFYVFTIIVGLITLAAGVRSIQELRDHSYSWSYSSV